jgi:ABC-type Fe3+/spermidine/putrescine transport system ATPase subunit
MVIHQVMQPIQKVSRKNLLFGPKLMSSNFSTLSISTKNIFFEAPKVVKAQYIGCYDSRQQNGIETIHEAVANLTSNSKGQSADISVTPHMISIQTSSGSKVDCSVKELTFLGMAKNKAICAFIMRKSSKFEVHVFHCKNSSLTLCKTIEAACKANL